MREKIEWIFRLYDIKKQGQLTREELYTVISSVYDMMGKNAYPPIDKWVVVGHVNFILEVKHLSSVFLNKWKNHTVNQLF